jgi:hypothetical protein
VFPELQPDETWDPSLKHCCFGNRGALDRKVFHINNCPTRCNNIHLIYICKLLYMFRVTTPLIVRSSYLQYLALLKPYCYLSGTYLAGYVPEFPSRDVPDSSTVSIMPDTVDTVIRAPDDE